MFFFFSTTAFFCHSIRAFTKSRSVLVIYLLDSRVRQVMYYRHWTIVGEDQGSIHIILSVSKGTLRLVLFCAGKPHINCVMYTCGHPRDTIARPGLMHELTRDCAPIHPDFNRFQHPQKHRLNFPVVGFVDRGDEGMHFWIL